MKNKIVIRLLAIVLAVAMPLTTAVFTFAEERNTESYSSDIKYDSPDINELTGLGEEPEDLSVSAGAEYMEKAWYEYVTYSDKAVASYRLNDEQRLLFYDPYTYTNAMVMDVQFDATTTEFDTMSSYTISKTNTKTMSACVSSTQTDTTSTQTSGRDVTYSNVTNGGETKTIYNHSIDDTTSGTVVEYTDYSYVMKKSASHTIESGLSSTLHAESAVGVEENGFTALVTAGTDVGNSSSEAKTENYEWYTDRETNTTEYLDGYTTTTKYTGEDKVEYNTNSVTEGWTELSARITKSVGSSRSTSTSWSEEESITTIKTYAATHFASDGVTPLPWAIVHYEVQMPMKCVLQVKYSGEWVTISTAYCILTTVKGTCRAWMQNGQVYYEDWGNGEPVVATDFWGQFLTKEQLMSAYTNKLYPVGGEG